MCVSAPSLYARYIAEREGFETIETTQGFATYKREGADMYLRDIYVLPEAREQGECFRLADHVAAKGRERGCTHLVGTVDLRLNEAERSMKVLLAYGFHIRTAHPDFLVFEKSLRGDKDVRP